MRKSVLVIGVLTALCISGCTQNGQSNGSGSEPNLPENRSIAKSPDRTIQIVFGEPAANESGDIGEETADFTIYIPKDWKAVSTESFEDGRRAAEVLPAAMNDSGLAQNELEEMDFLFGGDAYPSGAEFTPAPYAGNYYHGHELPEGDLTVSHNHVTYRLNTGDGTILILFDLAGEYLTVVYTSS